MMKKWTLFLAAVAVALSSCKPDDLVENQPPETAIFVSSINLSGDDRLSSEVELFWSGSDRDGYVTGFELSLDGTNWEYTNATDSTFSFVISAGSDTTDIQFYVRAIDNLDERDPTPAFLNVPIKNSPPTAVFDSTIVAPDTSLIATTLYLSVNDPDGIDNLDSIFIKLNNGPWYSLGPNVATVTLVPQNPTASGTVTSDVYRGGIATLLSKPIQGLNLGGDNTFYLRARDFAGEFSEVDTSKLHFVGRKTGDLLIVDTHSSATSPTPESIYFPILNSVATGGYDYINLQANSNRNLPPLWNPTFYFAMREYDKVFWYADVTLYNNELYLESAASIIQEYLNGGGKLLVSTPLPTDFDNLNSSILGFSPIDSLSSSVGQARIQTGAAISPEGGFATNYDTLRSSSFITGADPFYIKQGAEIMFRAEITPVSGWTGPDVVAGAIRNGANNINQVFVSVELHRLNNDPAALQTFFDQVLNNAFNW